MRAVLLLCLLVACSTEERPIAKRIRDACGNAPRMDGMAMQQGLPWEEGAKDEMVIVDPRDYDAVIKWRDCVAALR